jgi:hypothetical protein
MPKADKTANEANILFIWSDDIGISNLRCYSLFYLSLPSN